MALIDRPAVQVGTLVDPLIDGAIDARGASLAATASILEQANGMVAVEGGMAHLGAAVGLRSTVLFGPTPIVSFGYPGNRNLGTARCLPCFWFEGWAHNVCALGASSCVNFPDVADALQWVPEPEPDLVLLAEIA